MQEDAYAPLKAAISTDIEAVRAYVEQLFQYVDWSEGGVISLLGIGEKGTDKEGRFRERKFLNPRDKFMFMKMQGHLDRWAANNIASFIVPAVVKDEAEAEGDVKLERVGALTSICVDIDSGNTASKLMHAETFLGGASFLVQSGGKTEDGSQKIHAYWLLSEPETNVEDVARLRKLLAMKIGGDQSFGRATQVIRIPGSVHGKGGIKQPVLFIPGSSRDYHLDELADAIGDMPFMEGCEPSNVIPLPLPNSNGMMDFSGGAGFDQNRVATALTTEIREGGDGERTRWSQFSVVAGHEISNYRKGLVSLEQGFENVCAWVLAKMSPPWPLERVKQEWTALINVDTRSKGELKPPPPPGDGIRVSDAIERIETTEDLLSWQVAKRSHERPADRVTLVDGLVFGAKRHMLVAEGGAGKTFLMMELMLKMAAAGADNPQFWMGQPIRPDAYGKYYILLTGEDDVDELDIRWHAIDPNGALRRAAGERLIALPMDNLGGAFPLVAYHPHTREPVASDRWSKLYTAIKGITAKGGEVGAIGMDTLNSTLHGEENSAAIIGEYVRAVAPVCGDLKAALIVTHHVRKPGNEPIRDLDDMRAAIRGSTALPNAMRLVIGIFHAHDWQKQMKLMGLPPQRNKLYCAGVLKTNMPSFEGLKYLLRSPSGILEDVSMRVASVRSNHNELRAWLEFCIGTFAELDMFFSPTSKDNGLFKQREKLHPMLAALPRKELEQLAGEMLQEGVLIQRSVQGMGTGHSWLDLAANRHVHREKPEAGEAVPQPNWDRIGYYDPHAKKVQGYA